MFFTAKRSSESAAGALRELERMGARVTREARDGKVRYHAALAGWDEWVLPVTPSSIASRVRIDWDEKERALEFRWIYWTPVQVAAHLGAALAWVAGASTVDAWTGSAAFAAFQLVPVALAATEALWLQGRIFEQH